jgi:pimeloyl-ACP methyl ester carboxylesterase
MAPWLYAGRATPELRRAHAQAMSRVAPSTLRARVAAILAVDYRPLLRRVEVPLMYLRAAKDRLIPESAGRSIRLLRPDIEVLEIDAPHFLLQTEPARCADAVMGFIHRHTDGPAAN